MSHCGALGYLIHLHDLLTSAQLLLGGELAAWSSN
jgi:hypothetical protein